MKEADKLKELVEYVTSLKNVEVKRMTNDYSIGQVVAYEAVLKKIGLLNEAEAGNVEVSEERKRISV